MLEHIGSVMRSVLVIIIAFFCITAFKSTCYSNPFAIDFPEKKELTTEDYVEIQKKLRTIDIRPLVKDSYVPNKGYTIVDDFHGRCSRGLRQTLVDPEKGHFPSQQLVKIGKGGDNCIVSCVAYDGMYPELVKSIVNALGDAGFNGFFLYQMGGFPNPTGKEIKYVGVPYSFKIFMMMEAKKQGFNKVLWIDSAAFPLRDPKPLFDWIDKKGALIYGWKVPDTKWKYIFPSTRKLLQDLTGTDVLNSKYVCTVVFGLKMDHELTLKLIDTYYQFAEMGTPFLSCFPEEFVLSAIIGQPEFKPWKHCPSKILKDAKDLRKPKKRGYFFFHRKH